MGDKMVENPESEGESSEECSLQAEEGDKSQLSPSESATDSSKLQLSSSDGASKDTVSSSAPAKTKPRRRNLGLFGKKKEVNYVHVRNTGGENDVPMILTDCIAEVKKRGENVEGIFRVSGLKEEVAQILKSYEKGKPVPLGDKDIHAVTCTLKQYLNGMKVPIMTYELYDSFIETFKLPEHEQLKGIKAAVQNLPPGNRFCVSLVMELLHFFLPLQPVTKMGPENFAICFTPSMMWSRGTAGSAAELTNTINSMKLVSRMISDYKYIFIGKSDSSDVPQDENFRATLRKGQVELAFNLIGEIKPKRGPADPVPSLDSLPPNSDTPRISPSKSGAKKKEKVNLQNLFEHSSSSSSLSSSSPLSITVSNLPPPITGTEEEYALLSSSHSLSPLPPSIVESYSMGNISEMDLRQTIGKMSSAEVANITKMLYECIQEDEAEE